MDNKLLISFVIPAYNAEATLSDCVKSIVGVMSGTSNGQQGTEIKQTSGGIGYQIIIVDDGSTDQTLSIASDLAVKYSQTSVKCPEIVVVHQDNKGLGAARNTGIDASEGRYVAFVDADDIISSGNPAGSAEFSILDQNYDIIAIPIYKIKAGRSRKIQDGTILRQKYGSTTQAIPFGESFLTGKDYLRGRNVIPCVCAYLWKREAMKTRFTEGIYHEDEEFTVVSMLRGGSLYCSDKLFRYDYIVRENSITTDGRIAKKRLSDIRGVIARLDALAESDAEYKDCMKAKLLWLRIDYLRQLLIVPEIWLRYCLCHSHRYRK